jgi:hypothetical protein
MATMLGVAMPGIAPTGAGAPPPEQPVPPMRGEQRTMMGVAMPGIAPVGPGEELPAAPEPAARRGRVAPAAAIPPIVPAPPPLVHDEPLPQAPVKAEKRGLPLAVVAGGVAVLAAVAGLLVFLFWKPAPPLIVQPRLGPQGNEQLRLSCESCPDGTVASVLGEKGTFKDKEAFVDLKSPLKLGDNPVDIGLDRPNAMGRDETVKAVVPVSYRIRADLSEIAAAAPVIQVRVEAVSGAKVSVNGVEVTLDPQGKGSHAIDIRPDTEGPSDDGKIIEKTIPYEVTPPKPASGPAPAVEKGSVTARVGVVPLHIDSPSTLAITDGDRFIVAGRTAKGATVSVNGRALASNTGIFSETFEVPKTGETAVEVRSIAPQVAPRTARLTVRRVDKLDAEAKTFEAAHSLGYDMVKTNIEANVGQGLAIEGDVIESRILNHQTVALISDRRGCGKAPCLVRVLIGGDLDLKPKETVRAYGRITKPFPAPDGTSVPEVEAHFVLRGKSK